MRIGLAGVVACISVVLVSCSDSPPISDLSIGDFVRELDHRREANSTAVVELSLAEVYGDQWKEFAIACPYSDATALEKKFGLTEAPFDNYLDQYSVGEYEYYMYLSDGASSIEWLYFPSEARINFCTVSGAGTSRMGSTSEKLAFQITDYGYWERIETR